MPMKRDAYDSKKKSLNSEVVEMIELGEKLKTQAGLAQQAKGFCIMNIYIYIYIGASRRERGKISKSVRQFEIAVWQVEQVSLKNKYLL